MKQNKSQKNKEAEERKKILAEKIQKFENLKDKASYELLNKLKHEIIAQEDWLENHKLNELNKKQLLEFDRLNNHQEEDLANLKLSCQKQKKFKLQEYDKKVKQVKELHEMHLKSVIQKMNTFIPEYPQEYSSEIIDLNRKELQYKNATNYEEAIKCKKLKDKLIEKQNQKYRTQRENQIKLKIKEEIQKHSQHLLALQKILNKQIAQLQSQLSINSKKMIEKHLKIKNQYIYTNSKHLQEISRE